MQTRHGAQQPAIAYQTLLHGIGQVSCAVQGKGGSPGGMSRLLGVSVKAFSHAVRRTFKVLMEA